MFGTPSVGDHVRVTRTHTRVWRGDVKSGSFGIVREMHYGCFSSEVVVELANGLGRVRLQARDVRRTGGHGERGFERARDWHRAKLVAAAITALTVAIPLVRYRLAGGAWGDLVLPLFEEVVATAFALISGPFGLLAVLGAAVLVLRRRGR